MLLSLSSVRRVFFRSFPPRVVIGRRAFAPMAAPLIKPVIARTRDIVVVSADGIRVNGSLLPNTVPKNLDAAGRPLPVWLPGTYAVAPEMVWVASTYHPNSFDSRYFGPISIRAIRHWLRPLWVLGSAPTAR
jgi:type IV secretory pathway protease TraF